jgi:hypothetical protein
MTSILVAKIGIWASNNGNRPPPTSFVRFDRGGLGAMLCGSGAGAGDVEYLRGLLGYDY